MHQLVTESAERNPAQIAVAASECKLSYGGLEEIANQTGRQLLQWGVGRGDRVGIFAPKSAESVSALIGIQKAGAAYVPVDPYSPFRRASFILSDCKVRAVVTTSEKLSKLPWSQLASNGLKGIILIGGGKGVEKIPLPPKVSICMLDEIRATQPSEHLAIPHTDNDLAYILYTSGSTGEPKGVMISHLNALTFVNWSHKVCELRAADRVSNHAPLHFDLSVFDLFSSFKAGATVYLVPHALMMFPQELAGWIARQEISVWYSVPSALIQLLERGNLEQRRYDHLRLVLFAGEVFPIRHLRRLMQLLPGAVYYNFYGPTETNVCTYYRVQAEDLLPERVEPIPIGKACENTEVFALKDSGELTDAGETGELYVRSSTVMKGYWNLPVEAEKVLLPNSLNPYFPEQIYRTGDIVRRLEDDNYQYIGRRDRMIKTRGHRVEPGEIESSLYSHPQVLEAAVIALPDETFGARIKACVVTRGGISQAELEKICRQRLPAYMVPELWELRQQLPRTSTGKIDRATLLEEEKS